MKNDLHRWRKEACRQDWIKLAQIAGTSVGYLDQIAYSNRRASPKMAIRIEEGTKEFSEISPVEKESLVFATPQKNHVS
ncbi:MULTISPECIES: transcriptional regulator [unclassified Photorhabdus]|uniref:transcriptional regulator n=1 Tax=unclassified Photorhabdus TaxID=2620880 RepID=UPI000DCDE588|nr:MULTISPECIES: transcriptional regulator [unclassified Photorhabdus]RAW91619.1 transcriptional regulator [Photorhabdus sp. S9-53]RAW91631.1 transcriptional regulator [Photorhabdus sp. S10-54]RAW95225.1 transcriptional regulator [Photorhabdus sp. S8-52]